MSAQVNLRMERGEAIAREFGNVTRIDEGHYQVRSQSREMQYDVIAGEWGWLCSCPDSAFRGSKCKHSWAVEISFQLRRQVEEATRSIRSIEPISLQTCVACGSASLMKWGVRKTKMGGIQKFKCPLVVSSFPYRPPLPDLTLFQPRCLWHSGQIARPHEMIAFFSRTK